MTFDDPAAQRWGGRGCAGTDEDVIDSREGGGGRGRWIGWEGRGGRDRWDGNEGKEEVDKQGDRWNEREEEEGGRSG